MKNERKGFTIVELVIVIAVIAILASVLVPTFSGIVLKAQRSADTQVVRMLNEDVAIGLASSEKTKFDTMYDAVQACVEQGLSPDKIAAKSDYRMAWEISTGRFVLIDTSLNKVMYPQNDVYTEYDINGKEEEYFVVTTYDENIEKGTFKYSIYAYGNDWPSEVIVNASFDSGNVTGINKLIYVNKSDVSKNIIIRTNTFNTRLDIDAELDTVNHYGDSGIINIKCNEYYENGFIGKLTLNKGYAEICVGSTIYQLEQEGNTSSNLTVKKGSTVYGISTEKLDYEIYGNNELFSNVNTERIDAKNCLHNEGTEIFSSAGKEYNVCLICGSTLLNIGSKIKTAIDSDGEDLIVEKGYYQKGYELIENSSQVILDLDEVLITDHNYLAFKAVDKNINKISSFLEYDDPSVTDKGIVEENPKIVVPGFITPVSWEEDAEGTYITEKTNAVWEYSKDGKNWKKGNSKGETINLKVGEMVFLRGIDCATNTSSFCMSGKISASGSVTSLIDNCGEDPNVKMLPLNFGYMFAGCYSLIQAPELPALTLTNNCYYNMFSGCANLTQAPELPSTTLANNCYENMFVGCISLTEAPNLPAMKLAKRCYYGMFFYCLDLVKAPSILPATTLTYLCYFNMFRYCTSLTKAPVLPAEELADFCYNSMFSACESLKEAPALPAITLKGNCYGGMFANCTSLTEAPALPATTLAIGCYYYMFEGCTSLMKAPTLPAKNLEIYCYSNMFYGCESLTEASALPALTLKTGCYESMFANCASLVKVPALPATSSALACYNNMFEGCTSLYVSDSKTADASFAWKIKEYKQKSYEYMFTDCLGTRNETTISGSRTYYTQYAPIVEETN